MQISVATRLAEERHGRARPARVRRALTRLLGLAVACTFACAGPTGDREGNGAPPDSAAVAEQGAGTQPGAPGSGAVSPASQDDPTDAPPPDEAEATSGARRPWVDPPVTADREVAGAATLAAVRTARHDGYDRLVFDFGDGPLPSYRIAYLAGPATQCGSGEPVPLDGAATLEIAFQPAHAHTEEGRATVQERDRSPGLPALRRLALTCDFEAHVDWAAALDGRRQIRVLELAAPNRVVIDVRHPPG